MKTVLILIHVAICVSLILIVLLQRGKGADLGAAFGGSSQAVFGTTGATTLLHKVTTIVAIIFMLTSLGLSIFIGRGGGSSVMEGVTPPEVPAAQGTQQPGQSSQGQN